MQAQLATLLPGIPPKATPEQVYQSVVVQVITRLMEIQFQVIVVMVSGFSLLRVTRLQVMPLLHLAAMVFTLIHQQTQTKSRAIL